MPSFYLPVPTPWHSSEEIENALLAENDLVGEKIWPYSSVHIVRIKNESGTEMVKMATSTACLIIKIGLASSPRYKCSKSKISGLKYPLMFCSFQFCSVYCLTKGVYNRKALRYNLMSFPNATFDVLYYKKGGSGL